MQWQYFYQNICVIILCILKNNFYMPKNWGFRKCKGCRQNNSAVKPLPVGFVQEDSQFHNAKTAVASALVSRGSTNSLGEWGSLEYSHVDNMARLSSTKSRVTKFIPIIAGTCEAFICINNKRWNKETVSTLKSYTKGKKKYFSSGSSRLAHAKAESVPFWIGCYAILHPFNLLTHI